MVHYPASCNVHCANSICNLVAVIRFAISNTVILTLKLSEVLSKVGGFSFENYLKKIVFNTNKCSVFHLYFFAYACCDIIGRGGECLCDFDNVGYVEDRRSQCSESEAEERGLDSVTADVLNTDGIDSVINLVSDEEDLDFSENLRLPKRAKTELKSRF